MCHRQILIDLVTSRSYSYGQINLMTELKAMTLESRDLRYMGCLTLAAVNVA